jgi:putative membrane-bound dehydrogenase-like protein
MAGRSGGAEPPHVVGPTTEQRFPPLVVPDGFGATLFACDPLVEYPSVIALGPHPGTLFVAHDYMTGLGLEIVRRDEVRLLADSDRDGYADTSTVYADGFNSIQGLEYHDGTVLVMHAPLLTALRDTTGDGTADERHDLIKGLGLPPEENPNRLHCANGVVAAHDGWLYLALGDRGCDVQRPEGDRLLLEQGGILRCRPNGTDLHVFSTGLRNIYDVALDADLNVFVRDNENDGGDYLLRVFHCFFGSDHGYPYHYYERPDEAIAPLVILGRGSSAGGTNYLESAFPEEFRQSTFWCEWGRAVVRYRCEPKGSGFAPMQEVDFAAGAANDPYGFKPTDLVVDYDGSLLVSDWCDGQRPQRGRGRIYRIQSTTAVGAVPDLDFDQFAVEELLSRLDAEGHHARWQAQERLENMAEGNAQVLEQVREACRNGRLGLRGRMHAVWVMAHTSGANAIDELHDLAQSDADTGVAAQAIRAIADLADPVLAQHRLEAGRGDQALAVRLAELAQQRHDPRLLLEILVALARLQWRDAPEWLQATLRNPDPALAHAALQLLRRCDNWPAVLELLDEPANGTLRTIVLRAIAEQPDPVVVDGLLARLSREPDAGRRREYADLLSRVHRKPGPWTYWGFRPGPRTPNTETWDDSVAIEQALNARLGDDDRGVRAYVLARMQRELIAIETERLARWLAEESDAEHVAAILDAVKGLPTDDIRRLSGSVVVATRQTENNRLAALSLFAGTLGEQDGKELLEIAGRLEDGPVLADALSRLAARTDVDPQRLLLGNLSSGEACVRAAAIAALSTLKSEPAKSAIAALLNDADADVRGAAVAAAGELQVANAADRVLELARDSEPSLRRTCLVALGQLRDGRAVELAAESLSQRDALVAALQYLAEFGSADQRSAVMHVAESTRDAEVYATIVRMLSSWQKRVPVDSNENKSIVGMLTRIQWLHGMPLDWSLAGPLSTEQADQLAAEVLSGSSVPAEQEPHLDLRVKGVSTDGLIPWPSDRVPAVQSTWMALAFVFVDEPADVEFLAASNGTLALWVNDQAVFQRDKPAQFQPDSDRFPAHFEAGFSGLLVRVTTDGEKPQAQLRFRRRSSKAEHERLSELVLGGGGNVDRGREVFKDVERSLCLKCHRLGAEGGRIGPDLTGIGRRYSRVHILESILQPSRTITPSYESAVVALTDGQVLTGVKVAESAATLTLGDNQGQTHEIPRGEIDELRVQSLSTMPEGLETKLTDQQFVDLIAFLAAQKE